MKTKFCLHKGWKLLESPFEAVPAAKDVASLCTHPDENWLEIPEMPRQVQEALCEAGKIEDPAAYEAAAKCLWVGERDWVYRLEFDAEAAAPHHRLLFEGLDTLVTVYLNGERIARHDNLFLPLEIDVTGRLQGKGNELLLYFQTPYTWLEGQEMPEHLKHVKTHRLLRKPHEDFNNFNGAHPRYTTIGPYRDVWLITTDAPEIRQWKACALLDPAGTTGRVVFEGTFVKVEPSQAETLASLQVLDPSGMVVVEKSLSCHWEEGVCSINETLELNEPQLWYPRGYGEQPLYKARLRLLREGRELDRCNKQIGFRHLEVSPRFEVKVNGHSIKLWGASWTSPEGRSKRHFREYLLKTLDMVENANMVTLRIWGPGAPYDEEIYDECDRRGILTWAEFFHTWGDYPDLPEYFEACRKEAIHEVNKLSHHPSLFMWCGGNEVYMGCHIGNKREPQSRELFEKIYPQVVRENDPEQRFYHINSPHGGAFPNDAREGDSHGYTHQWFLPGIDYPVLFTENMRNAPPMAKSLRRTIPDELFWPEGFDGRIPPRKRRGENSLPQDVQDRRLHDAPDIPESWSKLSHGADSLMGRFGPVGDFYDTGDTPEGLIYRYGAAYSRWLRDNVERYRRGRPWHEADGPRRVSGHYLWRLNTTWPIIGSNIIDYFLEPCMGYYALRRAYAPVLVSLDISDHIRVWVVNDTPSPIVGTLSCRLYGDEGIDLQFQQDHQVSVPAGESRMVATMDDAGMFFRTSNLFACLTDVDGNEMARTNDIAMIERNLGFPDANLTLMPNENGDGILITTDKFARCIELTGATEEGNPAGEFGWYFEDNFFDLLPHETKEVRILGSRGAGIISAGSLFLSKTVKCPISGV